MDDDRIDFSVLDPKRDPSRFKRRVGLILSGARLAVPAPLGMVGQLVVWGRAAVAASALLAVAAWLPTLVKGGLGSAPSGLVAMNDPVDLVSQWARTGKVPTEIDPEEALGELYVR